MTNRTRAELYASVASFLFTFLAAITLAGCGPNLVSEEGAAKQPGSGTFHSGQSSDANYNCAASENIIPPDDRLMDGTHRYAACPNRASTTKVKLVGYSSSSRMSCVFPVQFINSTQFIYKLDTRHQPMFTCYDGWARDDNTAEVDFPATHFNGLIVVDQSLRVQMTTCLTIGENCPMHAIGQFR